MGGGGRLITPKQGCLTVVEGSERLTSLLRCLFCENVNNVVNIIGADLKFSVQGGQLYGSFLP